MKDELLLSVMVETYNQENYIAQTLDSIINQNAGFEYELLIGDDCSTDNTSKILDEYASKYDFIKVYHNEKNLGPMGNYYNVLSNCVGKYIMDCAGDDYWLPGKVKQQIDFMENNPDIGLCYGQAREWIEDKSCFSKKLFGTEKTTTESLLKGNDIPALTVCFRNSLIKSYLKEEKPLEKSWQMEDYPQLLWFSVNSRIAFLEYPLAVYRNLSESVSHVKDADKQFSFNKSYYDIAEYFAHKSRVQYTKPSDAEIYFYIYWNKLKKQYSRKDVENLRFYFNQLANKRMNIKLHMFLARHRFLFFCFLKVKERNLEE